MDKVSKEKRSKIMRAIRSKNTKPELIIRKLLTQAGYRYRIHKSGVPGRPDIAFPGRKKAIFVHGCFWHAHQNCKISHMPKTPLWQQKLLKNINRDTENLNTLNNQGWNYLIIWECEIKSPQQCIERLVKFIGPTKATD